MPKRKSITLDWFLSNSNIVVLQINNPVDYNKLAKALEKYSKVEIRHLNTNGKLQSILLNKLRADYLNPQNI